MEGVRRSQKGSSLLEQLILRGYRDFWHAVPYMAESLRASRDLKLFLFTGCNSIGSHNATYFSLLKDARRKRRLRALLLSPLAVNEMVRRSKTTKHSVEEYAARIFGTLETLNALRSTGALDVQVRLYDRDPEW